MVKYETLDLIHLAFGCVVYFFGNLKLKLNSLCFWDSISVIMEEKGMQRNFFHQVNLFKGGARVSGRRGGRRKRRRRRIVQTFSIKISNNKWKKRTSKQQRRKNKLRHVFIVGSDRIGGWCKIRWKFIGNVYCFLPLNHRSIETEVKVKEISFRVDVEFIVHCSLFNVCCAVSIGSFGN